MSVVKLKRSSLVAYRKEIQELQSNRCAICRGNFDEVTYHQVKRKIVPKYIPCLDHNHDTGMVRGVLCSYCNAVEGKVVNALKRWHREVKDDPQKIADFLINLADYYRVHMDNESGVIHPDHKTEEEKRELKNKRDRLKRKRARMSDA